MKAKFFLIVGCWPAILIFRVVKIQLDLGPALFCAISYCLVYLAVAGRENNITKLDLALSGYWFISMGLYLFDSPLAELFLLSRQTTFIYLFLFAAAFLPLLFGSEPFTNAFARRRIPEEFLQSTQFKKINKQMTIVWSLLFMIAALITLGSGPVFQILLPILIMVVIGIPFTRNYPAYRLRQAGLDGILDQSDTETAPHSAPLSPMPASSSAVSSISIPKNESFEDIDRKRRATARELGPVKNVLVILGSPRGKKGSTNMVLEQFLAGLWDNDVSIETIFLNEKKIRPCTGCFSCWTKTPGRCVQKDDMADILEKGKKADLVIHAVPLYVFSVPGLVKNFLDRRLPILEPYLKPGSGGLTSHPKRPDHLFGRRQLILSVCGFPEADHFEPLLAMYRAAAQVSDTPIVGEILRPASESLRFGNLFKQRYDAIMDAIYRAGVEVATRGYVLRETEEIISAPLFPSMDSFHEVANRFWDARLRYEAEKKNPDKGSLEEYMQSDPGMLVAGMAATYDPARNGVLEKIFQFEFTGTEQTAFHIELTPRRAIVHDGKSGAADLIVRTPVSIWKEIAAGALSGEEAFFNKLYTAEGEMRLLPKMQNIFMKGVKEAV